MSKKTNRSEDEEVEETEEESADPAVAVMERPSYVAPRKTPERFAGSDGAPMSKRYPRIIGGTCEACGVVDQHKPAEIQYSLCPHFQDMGELACSYCDRAIDPKENIKHKVVMVSDHPQDPSKVVCWCTNGPGNPGSDCEQKHLKRFTPSSL